LEIAQHLGGQYAEVLRAKSDAPEKLDFGFIGRFTVQYPMECP